VYLSFDTESEFLSLQKFLLVSFMICEPDAETEVPCRSKTIYDERDRWRLIVCLILRRRTSPAPGSFGLVGEDVSRSGRYGRAGTAKTRVCPRRIYFEPTHPPAPPENSRIRLLKRESERYLFVELREGTNWVHRNIVKK
jgi:hypothetical protein